MRMPREEEPAMKTFSPANKNVPRLEIVWEMPIGIDGSVIHTGRRRAPPAPELYTRVYE